MAILTFLEEEEDVCFLKFHVQFSWRVHYYIRCVIMTVHVVPMSNHVLVSRLADVA